jgi:hypothetical protein
VHTLEREQADAAARSAYKRLLGLGMTKEEIKRALANKLKRRAWCSVENLGRA